MSAVTGIHHITCIAGDAQENLDFYVGVLGMRLVKRSVNQDSPGTYHLFYADGAGHPGTDLTFFPWPEMAPASEGVGLTTEVGLAVPPGTLEWWMARLQDAGVRASGVETRFVERSLPFRDPHGLPVALVETVDEYEFAAWDESPVPASHQVRRLHVARLTERDLVTTERFLTGTLGLTVVGDEDGWRRYRVGPGGSGRIVDVREQPGVPRGRWGVGGVHHVAWRVPDDQAEAEARALVQAAGRRPTEVIDRFWFRSVYFLEPGGVLFELATDGPGFAIDEDQSSLGERLILPPWLEPQRSEIEAVLPPLSMPAGTR